MVAANALWQALFQRLLRHLMTCQEAGGCKLYMHPATISVKCTFRSAEPESDVVCVWELWLKAWYTSMGHT